MADEEGKAAEGREGEEKSGKLAPVQIKIVPLESI